MGGRWVPPARTSLGTFSRTIETGETGQYDVA